MEKATGRLTTNELKNGIIRTKDFKRYMKEHANSLQEQALPEYLEALMEKKGLQRTDVIQRSDLERSFAYQIFKGTRKPTRDKVLQLAIGFGLDCDETAGLLRVARKTELYPRLKRDAILIYCISHHMSIFETQYLLTSEGFCPLGEETEKG